MASFKADCNFRAHAEDMFYDSNESAEEYVSESPRSRSRARCAWRDENFEVLQELYRSFKLSGESVFGSAFFQYGDFHQFVNFIYENTLPDDADLLKARIAQTHVGALGLSTRGKHRLPFLQEAKDHGSDGSRGERVRGSWSEAVGANTTRRS